MSASIENESHMSKDQVGLLIFLLYFTGSELEIYLFNISASAIYALYRTNWLSSMTVARCIVVFTFPTSSSHSPSPAQISRVLVQNCLEVAPRLLFNSINVYTIHFHMPKML
jgi:hypothetical protein